MNCIECLDNFYKMVDTDNCYSISKTDEGYYLKNEKFYPCNQNCKTCFDDANAASNNCLSCDNNLYLVNELNNCVDITYKNNGYYLKMNENNIYIFYKCYQNCSTCNDGYEIDDSTGIEDFHCDECKLNNYKIKNTNNCYGEEIIEKGYRLIDGFWQDCHINCRTCDFPAIINITTGEEIQNCLTCIDGLNLIFNTTNCVNDSILNSSYYLSKIDNTYHKCAIQCSLCDDEVNLDDHHCLLCNENLGYYLAEQKLNSSCYNSTTIDSYYYLVNNTWIKCYDTCKTCNETGNITNNLCESCIDDYSFIYGETNCINETFAHENGYYLNLTYNQYLTCDIPCSTCFNFSEINDTNCDKCNNNLGYYKAQDKKDTLCLNRNQIEDTYYLNNAYDPPIWGKCHERCSKCTKFSDGVNMNCDSCISYILDQNGNKSFLYFYQGNCLENCPDGLYYTPNYECVVNCPKGTYRYLLNKTCVYSCPDNYVPKGINCLNNDVIVNKTTPTDLIKTIITDIGSYADKSEVIENEDFKAQIVASNDLDVSTQLKSGISAVDLGEVADILKEKYNIPSDQDIYIVEIETKKKDIDSDEVGVDIGKNVEFLIYDASGNELDLSCCENYQIQIIKSIEDIEEINFEQAKLLSLNDIDVFNASDPFFNEYCYPYVYNKSSDVILNDRRNYLYQNVTFCENECEYLGVDYELNAAKCSCYIKTVKKQQVSLKSEKTEKGITLNNIINNFLGGLYKNHYYVIKCYKLVFDSNIIKINIGFYIMIILVGLGLILLSIFIINGLKPIKNYMLVFEPFDPRTDPLSPPLKKNAFYYNKRKKNEEINVKNINGSDLENEKNESDDDENNDAIVVRYSNDNDENDKNDDSNSQSSEPHDKKNYEKSKVNKSNKIGKIDINNIKPFEINDDIFSRKKKPKKKGDETKTLKTAKNKSKYISLEKVKDNPKDKEIKSYNKKKLKQSKSFMLKNPFVMQNGMLQKELEDKKTKNTKNTKSKNYDKKNSKELLYKSSEKNLEKNTEENLSNFSSETEGNTKRSKNKKQKNIENIKNFQKNQKNLKRDEKYIKRKINSIDENINNKDKITSSRIQIATKKKLSEKKNTKFSNKIVSLAFTNHDLLNMNYSEASRHEYRSCLEIYWGYLLELHIYLHTFFDECYLDLKIIRFLYLIFNFVIMFFFNALLFNDTLVSEIFKKNGSLSSKSSLPIAFYSFLISILVMRIFKPLTSNRNELKLIIKKRKKKKDYIEAFTKVLKKLKIKLIILYCFVIIFSILFWYYVSAFCAVYQNSQKFWLYGCLESIAMDFCTPIVLCFILASLRYISLRKQVSCVYYLISFSNLLM